MKKINPVTNTSIGIRNVDSYIYADSCIFKTFDYANLVRFSIIAHILFSIINS